MFRPPPRAGPSWHAQPESQVHGLETQALAIEEKELCTWACALVGPSAVPSLQSQPDPTHPSHYRDGRLVIELIHRLVKTEADQGTVHPDALPDTTHDKSLESIRHLRHLRRNGTPAERWHAALDAVNDANKRGTDTSPEAALLHVRVNMPTVRELCLGTPSVVAVYLFVAFHVYVVRPRLPLVPTMARWFSEIVASTYDDDDPRIEALTHLALVGMPRTHASGSKDSMGGAGGPWYCAQSSASGTAPFGKVATDAGPSPLVAAFGDGVLLLLALRGVSMMDAVERLMQDTADGDASMSVDDIGAEVMSLETCYAAPYLLHVGDDAAPPTTDDDESAVLDPQVATENFRAHRHEILAANTAMCFAALDLFDMPSFFDSAADFVTTVEADAARAARCSTFLFMLAFSVFERFAETMIPSLARHLVAADPPMLPLPLFADSDSFPPLRAPTNPESGEAASPVASPLRQQLDDEHSDGVRIARVYNEAEVDAYVEGARERVAVVLELSPTEDRRYYCVPQQQTTDTDMASQGTATPPSSSSSTEHAPVAPRARYVTESAPAKAGQPAAAVDEEPMDLGLGSLRCQLLVGSAVCRAPTTTAAGGGSAVANAATTKRIVLASADARVEVQRNGSFRLTLDPPRGDEAASASSSPDHQWQLNGTFRLDKQAVRGADLTVPPSTADRPSMAHSVVTLGLARGGDRSGLAALPPPYDSGREPVMLLRFANADDAVILHAALSKLL